MISHAPKIKMMKEYGRHLRLDDDAEEKLIAGASACRWRQRTRQLLRDIVILMRDTGMRNERELFRMRIENLDWQNQVILVPDSKTPEGRRLVPMSGESSKFCRADATRGRRAGYFPQNALHRDICGRYAISFGKLGTRQDFRRNWFSIVRDMTTAREF